MAKATLKAHGGLILDKEKNRELEIDLHGGVVGIVLDTRGRQPFTLPVEASLRVPQLKKWMRELKAYPEDILS